MSINGLALGTNNISAQLATKLDIAGGKVLQVVRATDTTDRDTSSTSFVDASISVTITPQKSTSSIIVINTFATLVAANPGSHVTQITDSSNNAISGAEQFDFIVAGLNPAISVNAIGYATPGTTSAVTYKLRFKTRSPAFFVRLVNSAQTGQMFAIEVSA